MEKYHSTLVTLLIAVPALLVLLKIKKGKNSLFHVHTNLLLEKWNTARERRLLWKDQHLWNFNFDDPEYQELWEIEIGAEECYLLGIGNRFGDTRLSWQNYIEEREKSKLEEE